MMVVPSGFSAGSQGFVSLFLFLYFYFLKRVLLLGSVVLVFGGRS